MTVTGADDPTEFTALTENGVEDSIPVGVPEITQVVVLMLSPRVRDGDISQLVMKAPLALRRVGATVIATPTVPEVPVAPA